MGGLMEVSLAARLGVFPAVRLEVLKVVLMGRLHVVCSGVPLEAPRVVLKGFLEGGQLGQEVVLMALSLMVEFQCPPWHQMHHQALSPRQPLLLFLVLALQRFSLPPWSSLTMRYLAA